MSRRLALFLLAAAFAALPTVARACILEFRSADWQAAESPLIVVATVTRTTPDALPPQFANTFRNGLITPSTATISVQQTLKGTPPSPTLTVHCGPIRSCAPYPVHLQVDAGKTYIFLLTPAEDGYRLAWAGSLQETTALPAIRDSLARCGTWRADYLAHIQKQSPATLQAASTLDASLTQAARGWPTHTQESLTPAELLHGTSDDSAFTAAADALLHQLRSTPPAVVQTALALDFAKPERWSRHPLWQDALLRYADDHAVEIAALHQAEWTRLLTAAGATADQIHAYFARIDQQGDALPLAFPIPVPDPLTHLRGDTLTTDFLLRAQGFDRGQLYFSYGLQPDALTTLNRERLHTLLPVLLASTNDHLKWAATTALAEMH